VPVSKLTPLYDKVQTTDDLPELLMKQTVHFFEHYKDLEPGKWVKILGWGTVEDAKQEIVNGLAAATKSSCLHSLHLKGPPRAGLLLRWSQRAPCNQARAPMLTATACLAVDRGGVADVWQ